MPTLRATGTTTLEPHATSPTLVPPSTNPVIPDPAPSPDDQDMPLPHNPQTIFLGGLFFLAVMAVLYLTREVVLPVVMAVVLMLLLRPLVRALEHVRIPKAVGALIAVLLLLGVFVVLGTILSSSTGTWMHDLPAAMSKLTQRFAAVKGFMSRAEPVLGQFGMQSGSSTNLGIDPGHIATVIAGGVSGLASHLLETLLILFYLLVFGETFLRRLVEILPRLRDKKQAVEISMVIERDLSIYLITVTIINAIVGVITAGVMWAFGIPGAPLWGVVAFAFNYVPILGPFTGVALFLLVGLLTLGLSWLSVLPAVCYLGIHIAEGEIITPMLLSRRFTVNPVAMMLALLFWYWMWGVQGAILAVPMLAILKIIADRLRPLRALGHFLEG